MIITKLEVNGRAPLNLTTKITTRGIEEDDGVGWWMFNRATRPRRFVRIVINIRKINGETWNFEFQKQILLPKSSFTQFINLIWATHTQREVNLQSNIQSLDFSVSHIHRKPKIRKEGESLAQSKGLNFKESRSQFALSYYSLLSLPRWHKPFS